MYTDANGSIAVTPEPSHVSSTHMNISSSHCSLYSHSLSSVILTLKHCSESRVVKNKSSPIVTSKSSKPVGWDSHHKNCCAQKTYKHHTYIYYGVTVLINPILMQAASLCSFMCNKCQSPSEWILTMTESVYPKVISFFQWVRANYVYAKYLQN